MNRPTPRPAMAGFAVAAMLMVAACQQAPSDADNAVVGDPADTTNYVAEVLALSEPQRRGVMFRAIRDAGLPCQQVVAVAIEAEMAPTTWRATCDNGASHLIAMQPNGDATVMSGR